MSIIYTDKDKCRGCYACIRACPAKAIKVEHGIAQAIEERCIVCGNCLKACVTGAKQVQNDAKMVGQLLKKNPATIAIISSSFPAALPELRPGQLVSALRKLGFSEVMEESFGAELVGRRLLRVGAGRDLEDRYDVDWRALRNLGRFACRKMMRRLDRGPGAVSIA